MEGGAWANWKLSVFRLDEDFNSFRVGEIIWDGEQIRVEPEGVRELQEIASRPYRISTSQLRQTS